MIIYTIIIIFLLFFSLILFAPIKISVFYSRNKLDIKISNVSLNFLNKYIPRKKKVKKSVKKSKDYPGRLKKIYNTIKKNKAAISLAIAFLKLFISKLKINRFHLLIDVGSDDAKKCIMNWYKLHAILEYVFYLLKSNPKTKDLKLKIYPNFLRENLRISFNFEISFRVVSVFKCVYLTIESKNNSPNQKDTHHTNQH